MNCHQCGGDPHLGSCELESKQVSHKLRTILQETLEALTAATVLLDALEQARQVTQSDFVRRLKIACDTATNTLGE